MKTYNYNKNNIAHTPTVHLKKAQGNMALIDNRENSITQRKRIDQIHQQAKVIQKADYKTNLDTVAAELRYRDFNLFHSNFIERYRNSTIGFAMTSRMNNDINYRRLFGDTLSSKDGIEAWLGNEAGDHVYVYHTGNLIGGIDPGGDAHLPHPTLLGGDPTVQYAGEFNYVEEREDGKKVYAVDSNSGHFQPDEDVSVEDTIAEQCNTLLGEDSSYVIV